MTSAFELGRPRMVIRMLRERALRDGRWTPFAAYSDGYDGPPNPCLYGETVCLRDRKGWTRAWFAERDSNGNLPHSIILASMPDLPPVRIDRDAPFEPNMTAFEWDRSLHGRRIYQETQ